MKLHGSSRGEEATQARGETNWLDRRFRQASKFRTTFLGATEGIHYSEPLSNHRASRELTAAGANTYVILRSGLKTGEGETRSTTPLSDVTSHGQTIADHYCRLIEIYISLGRRLFELWSNGHPVREDNTIFSIIVTSEPLASPS